MGRRLDAARLTAYLSTLSGPQQAVLHRLRSLILQLDGDVDEDQEHGAWLRGYLKYLSPAGNLVYALGPKPGGKISLHLMPYHCSVEHRTTFQTSLTDLLSGNSSLDFARESEIPEVAMVAIMINGADTVDRAVLADR